MYVYEKMTKNPITVKENEPLHKAYKILNDTKHSQLPVINSKNELKGLITLENISKISPSDTSSLSNYEINFLLSSTLVKDIMTTGVYKINYKNSIINAALTMKENRITALCVVDDDNIVVGILTRTDVFSAFIDITNLKKEGLSITLQTSDDKDALFNLSTKLNELGYSPCVINCYKNNNITEIIVKLNSVSDLKVKDELENAGYKVINIIKHN